MKNNKLIVYAIVSAVLLVLGSLFILIAQRSLAQHETVKTYDYIFIALGTICTMASLITIFILIVKVLKEKKII